MDIVTLYSHNKHYIGSIKAEKFYYKSDILALYGLSLLYPFLPSELIDYIFSFLCTSLVVLATNTTLYYINPRDDKVVKTIKLLKIKELNEDNQFAISENGMTFMRIYRRHLELEYLCSEEKDPKLLTNKKLRNGFRYYHSYNIRKKCSFTTPIHKYKPMQWCYGISACLSSNGKYIASYVSRKDVKNRSGCYITICDAHNGQVVTRSHIDANFIIAMKFSPDNTLLAIIIQCNANRHCLCIWNIKTSELVFSYTKINYTLDNKIEWSPNSSNIIITCNFKMRHANSVVIISGLLLVSNIKTSPEYCIKRSWHNISKRFTFTWKNNSEFVCSSNNQIYTFTLDNNITMHQVLSAGIIVCDLTVSLDMHIMPIYLIGGQVLSGEPYYIENINPDLIEEYNLYQQIQEPEFDDMEEEPFFEEPMFEEPVEEPVEEPIQEPMLEQENVVTDLDDFDQEEHYYELTEEEIEQLRLENEKWNKMYDDYLNEIDEEIEREHTSLYHIGISRH